MNETVSAVVAASGVRGDVDRESVQIWSVWATPRTGERGFGSRRRVPQMEQGVRGFVAEIHDSHDVLAKIMGDNYQVADYSGRPSGRQARHRVGSGAGEVYLECVAGQSVYDVRPLIPLNSSESPPSLPTLPTLIALNSKGAGQTLTTLKPLRSNSRDAL